MTLYADSPRRRVTQLVLDLLLVCWTVLWVWVGSTVHDGIAQLAGPGERTAASATDLADSMSAAAEQLGEVPLVGSGVAAPFEEAAAASTSLAEAGAANARALGRLALWLGVSVAVVPVLLAAVLYLPGRVRFVREATAARRHLDRTADLELFALRAIAHQPLHVLGRVSGDPVGDWRRGDAATIQRLARLELAQHGIVARVGEQR